MLRFKPNGSDNGEDEDGSKGGKKDDKKERNKEYVVCPICDGKGWARTWDGKVLDPCPLCNGRGAAVCEADG